MYRENANVVASTMLSTYEHRIVEQNNFIFFQSKHVK
jgi:hypothetical protein